MDFQGIAQLGTNVFAADTSLTVEFYLNAQLDEKATEAAGGVPQYVDKPFVKIYVPGDQFNVVDQPAWIDARHPNAHNNRFPKQWAAFKANESQTSDGMPLKDFPLLAESQRKTLAFLEIRTVEQLASLSDDHCQKLPGGNELKRKAALYLDGRKDASHALKMAADLESRNAESAKLKADMAEMQAQLAELKKTKPEVKK
jgi:hypothetical protein